MSDNKKYYYMRLKEDFFESESMIILESMKKGYLYSCILLKLYCRSLKNNGRLMLSETIPYNPEMLAKITRTKEKDIKDALKIFQELGLIEVLDSGAIYMLEIQNYIGKSSTEGDRKRNYRETIQKEKNSNEWDKTRTFVRQTSDKRPPEIEIEIEKEIELEIEIEREKEAVSARSFESELSSFGEYGNVKLTAEQHKALIEDFGADKVAEYIKRCDEYVQQKGKLYNDYNLTIRKWLAEDNTKQNDNSAQLDYSAVGFWEE